MTRSPRAAVTTQFRTRLLRKLKNLYPDCIPEVGSFGKGAIAFRLKDARGRPVSQWIRVSRYRDGALTRTNLDTLVRAANPQRRLKGRVAWPVSRQQ